MKLLDFGSRGSSARTRTPRGRRLRPARAHARVRRTELLRGEPVTVTTDTWRSDDPLRAPRRRPLRAARRGGERRRRRPGPPRAWAAEAGRRPAARRRADGRGTSTPWSEASRTTGQALSHVAALTTDLGAWLADVPVSARPAHPRTGCASSYGATSGRGRGLRGRARARGWHGRNCVAGAQGPPRGAQGRAGEGLPGGGVRGRRSAADGGERAHRGRAPGARRRARARGAERQPDIQSEMLLTVAQVYRNLGMYAEAVPLVDEAVTIRTGLHGGAPSPWPRRSTSADGCSIWW